MSTKRTVGVVLCGFGRAGQIHFHGIRRNHRCKLLYVVDNKEVQEKINEVLDTYLITGVQIVPPEKYDEVMKDTNVDAVIVATPTTYHETLVRRGLKAHKAVFCEKPVAAEIDRIRECYELSEEVKRPLFCAFNRRFDHAMSNLRDRVNRGEIGKVYQIKTTSRDSPLPAIAYLKISKGMFHDCAIHDIDMVCWIVGEQPESVFAQGSAFDPEIKAIGDVDTIAIVLKFPSGVIASIDLSRHSQYGYDQRLEVLGSQGMLQVENVPENSTHSSTAGGTNIPQYLHSFPQRYKEAYERELDHFVSAVLEPASTLSVTKEEVLLSSKIATACEDSLKGGKVIFF